MIHSQQHDQIDLSRQQLEYRGMAVKKQRKIIHENHIGRRSITKKLSFEALKESKYVKSFQSQRQVLS